ncbi:UDP-N-acetylmuramoyl-L-alanyl-D-glutamate--2,6-diaminopimelate ligase [Curtobacterium flaccumfaciens pv. flaccumfaciens]|uniref:Mur ligase family protein n=1 Tax=Curtobacterium TaxID=2034 RepID=UPI00188B7261|nr:UDP-N-acetylmuramoyl-L-alanyl-D-glutamate--2,6-diaminopimelate ligase [Curtobacterium flaccumfaciens]MBF4627679.1 UDP-N-acetylmuramoyl-L-alanyl-D-glutamate--2,6-diaminopimelate ligase [Curtobacterium flaccumfaciens]MBO9044300.1 UDP-N-acetylmuramoyl-L-alanyl-D-glutamate--2,6-diaminopimelate ligase [Curtobacterium flaccumfaciens pv. flaccumfaciens]MBO9047272.1 UDP-N-acetylmuramoyl-L-alanyl-D-glutamate--2,6-diaminopimelate ligase [Curtobacterium flaccumfaciens pv. flaccumfaciens]MCS6582185.1 UD
MSARIPPVLRPEHPTPRAVSELANAFGLRVVGSVDSIETTGVTLSATEVQPGDLFVGVHGANRHGAQFATEAAERGAVAVLTDQDGVALVEPSGLPVLVVDDPRAALGDVAAWVYRTHPDEATDLPQLFAVTGTNGKTSTSYILEGILKQLGLVTGLSSTAERHIGSLSVTSRLTTPEASEMHALLARMRESEVRAVAVEVSAQALSRHRVDGIVFDVAAFTNLSHDHLDDYADMEEYYQAKLPLFQPEHARRGVVSLDTDWGHRVVQDSRIPVTTITVHPDVEAEWHVDIVEAHAAYTEFRLTGPEGRELTTRVPLIGWHMAANAALAIVMLVEGGFELGAIAHALESNHRRYPDEDDASERDGETDRVSAIECYLPGRTERVSGEHGPSVYVDFGHSADAFENTLAAVRQFTSGKVLMLFGADGDRDTTKRGDMARVAAAGSDILVVTDHHPRFEDAASIRKTLVDAARAAYPDHEIHEVSPPEAAIRTAVSLVGEGDSILWAGPGHQDYRDIQGVRTPYSARDEARAALREAGWEPNSGPAEDVR